MSSDYEKLISYVKKTEALSHASSVIAWDQETMMPKGAVEQRADCLASIESEIHNRNSNLLIGELLESIEIKNLNKDQKSNIFHIKKSFERASKVPNDLATNLAKISSLSQMSWVNSKNTKDTKEFLKYLREVIRLKREEASCISTSDNFYDALIDDFEPGMTSMKLDKIFSNLRKHLINLRKKIQEKNNKINELNFIFDEKIQLEVSNELAKIFGYDFNIGRIDISQHPFSTGLGNDVRITTRLDKADPFNCFYSTIHETGHAVYEQNIPKSFIFTPNGHGVSMGVHESQSRIFENQFGRSREFCSYLFNLMKLKFGDFGIKSEEEFYKIVNNVKNSFIRTESDEVNYNLHILMRYDLEKELFRENLQVEDLEAAWNERFKLDFNRDVTELSDGFLQDVHWSAGLFGYFPTYTLGNIYAGCLFEKIINTNKNALKEIEHGKFNTVLEWLKRNIYIFGSTEKPEKIISNAIEKDINEEPLMEYLNKKFNDIYI